MCPGMLVYALPPSLNKPVQIDKYNWSQPEEAASYANFLISNPAIPELVSIRVNGNIAASKSSFLPISKEFKGFQVTDVATGLKRVNDFNFRFLTGAHTASDSVFVRGGNGNIIYQNQSVLVIDSALRSLYGGRGSSVSCVMANAVTSTFTPPNTLYGSGNVPITIKFPLRNNGGIFGTAQNTDTEAILPFGYQFQQDLATFADAPSILLNNARRGSFVFGSGGEFFLGTGMVNPPITVVNGGVGLTAATSPGSGSRIPYTGTPTVVSTNKVRVAAPKGQTREITLTGTFNSPFYSNSGNIRNSAGTVVGTCSSSEVICGWGGVMFTIGSAVSNNQATPPGSSIKQTDLVSIFADLLRESKLPYTFGSGFNETVYGYLTNREDTTTDLSNLMAVFRKIVYQRRDGTLVFIAYPTLTPDVLIKREHHMVAPEINTVPADQISDALNFSYRDIEREFDSTTIRVGGDQAKTTDFTIELVAGGKDASVYAQNLRNFQLSQVISGTLQLHPICNTIEPGDTYILEALTTSGLDIPIIILRVETGVDGSIRAEFINWAKFTPLSTSLVEVGTSPVSVSARVPKRSIVDTEKRSNSIGLTYYTEEGNTAVFAGSVITPSVSNLAGFVEAITPTTATVVCIGQIPLNNTEYYILNETTGEGTWIKVSAVTNPSTDTYDLTFVSGLYASAVFTAVAPNMSIFALSENNTANDNYTENTFTQSGNTYTWGFNSRKRLREPVLAYITAESNTITFNRQDSLLLDNLDLGDSSVLPVTTFRIRNTTTSIETLITTSAAVINTTLVFLTGHIITITQVNSSGGAFPGAIINNYTVP